MIPIYEQGTGRGIGHNLESFSRRFAQLCEQHLREKRAKAFAFIFYDFTDSELRKILKDQGVFARLDRLAGNQLSVFYLHSGSRKTVTRFNDEFFAKLGIKGEVMLPCVVFFKFSDGNIHDIRIAQLENANLLHGFHELYGAIERYLGDKLTDEVARPKYVRWIKSTGKFIAAEAFRALLDQSLPRLI